MVVEPFFNFIWGKRREGRERERDRRWERGIGRKLVREVREGRWVWERKGWGYES